MLKVALKVKAKVHAKVTVKVTGAEEVKVKVCPKLKTFVSRPFEVIGGFKYCF